MTNTTESDNAMLSVIIPTRNRAEMLAGALESLTKQSLPLGDFETLVVDNGSTDATPQVVEAYGGRLPNLRRIFADDPGLHVGRHAGMAAAQGDLLVFVDDDIEAFPTWLAAIRGAFADPGVAMVGGNNIPMYLAEPPDWIKEMWRPNADGVRAISALSIIEFPMQHGDISPSLVWGCNFAIRKRQLKCAGGFHPDGMPKDLIVFRGDGETHVSRFVAASGLRCAFRQEASVYHKVTAGRMTYEYFRARGFAQGVSDSYASLRGHGRLTGLAVMMKALVVRPAVWMVRELQDLRRLASVRSANQHFRSGYLSGFVFHQRSFLEREDVRKWVNKSTYW